MKGDRARLLSLGEGLLVTVLWASSFAIIKVGFAAHLTPLLMAGTRYAIASTALLTLAATRPDAWRVPTRPAVWLQLAATGLLVYPISQGGLFWALQHTSAATASWLYFCVGPIVVFVAGALWLKERPLPSQFLGLAAVVLGGWVFASGSLAGTPLGIVVVTLSAIAFTGFSLFGRRLARTGEVSSLALTAVPLAVGAVALLAIALPVEGVPPAVGIEGIVAVFWLALVNTAFANVLWNHALRRLMAFELNAVGGAIPLEAAVIAWVLLGEGLTTVELLGLAIVLLGILMVQHPRLLTARWQQAARLVGRA